MVCRDGTIRFGSEMPAWRCRCDCGAELPVADQERLAAGEPIEILRPETGEIVRKSLGHLSFPEISVAVRHGRILSAADQRKSRQTAPLKNASRSTMVQIRLAPDTLNMARALARADGMSTEHHLRGIILREVSRLSDPK